MKKVFNKENEIVFLNDISCKADPFVFGKSKYLRKLNKNQIAQKISIVYKCTVAVYTCEMWSYPGRPYIPAKTTYYQNGFEVEKTDKFDYRF